MQKKNDNYNETEEIILTDELKMEVPTLTLEPEKAEAEVPAEEIVPVNIEDKIQLSDEEMKVVDNFVKQIDISNTTHVLQYGADAQKKMADFSDMALEKVRTKDLGTVGDTLSELIVELKGFSALEEENKGIKGLFRKAANPVVKLKAKYDKAEVNVEKVVDVLEGHQVTLTKDIAVLDEMFAANNTNFKQLSMYIVAGKKKLEEAQNVTLPQLKAKAEASGEAADAQAANDFASMCNRFEKKLHDLDLTRTVSLQMAPQIRMVQNNDALMVEKIQTTLVNTIPLWKSQMVLALGLANNEAAVEAQKAVSDTTNELLKKNAEVLKKTTVDVARESERGIVDIETLKNTNRQLIETIDEVMKIQQEGREKRKAAEVELAKIELELKNKLLETRG